LDGDFLRPGRIQATDGTGTFTLLVSQFCRLLTMLTRLPVTKTACSVIIEKHPREESTDRDCVSQKFKNSKPHFHTTAAPALNGQADSNAAEARVRQLIANGKSKVALDGAKEIHKAQGTAASEALLVDAYAARIRSLLGQSLAVEAKALIDLVRDRYPSARERLEELTASAAARAGTLDELVGPLNDPAITQERRSAIEHAIQRHVCDLAALARCAALAPEDSLRKAACALERAFLAVTTGPVADVC